MALNSDVSSKLWQGTKAAPAAEEYKFTTREREVLGYLSEGKTNAEIAAAFGVTEKTVRDHVGNILARLNLRDRTQAALWAQKNLT
jgi:DNA-binding NarL/FixJ family response regulator